MLARVLLMSCAVAVVLCDDSIYDRFVIYNAVMDGDNCMEVFCIGSVWRFFPKLITFFRLF